MRKRKGSKKGKMAILKIKSPKKNPDIQTVKYLKIVIL